MAAQGQNFELLQTRQISENVLRDQQRVSWQSTWSRSSWSPTRPTPSCAFLAKRKDDFLEVHVRHVLVKDRATADQVRQELVADGN